MVAQYLAGRLSCGQLFEALQSQDFLSDLGTYLFPTLSVNLRPDCSQAVFTSKMGWVGSFGLADLVEPDRSLRCPRASNCLPCSPSLQAFPPVVASRKKKSSSLSTQSRSALSLSTQASTSKHCLERAFGPAPTPASSRGSEKKPCMAFAKLLQEFWLRGTQRWTQQQRGAQC